MKLRKKKDIFHNSTLIIHCGYVKASLLRFCRNCFRYSKRTHNIHIQAKTRWKKKVRVSLDIYVHSHSLGIVCQKRSILVGFVKLEMDMDMGNWIWLERWIGRKRPTCLILSHAFAKSQCLPMWRAKGQLVKQTIFFQSCNA